MPTLFGRAAGPTIVAKGTEEIGRRPHDNLVDTQNPGEVNRPSGRRWLLSGVAVVLLAAMAAYVSKRHEELAYFQRLSASVLIITLFFQFLSQLFFNGAMLVPLQIHVKGLGFWEFFMVRTGGLLIGNILPVAGGVAVRLAYLRGRGLTYADFAWATLLSNVLALGAAAALAVVAVGVLWMVAGTPPTLVLGLSAGLLALSVATLAAVQLTPRMAGQGRLQNWRWLSGSSGFKVSRRTITSVFSLSLARHCLNFATFGLLYQSLNRLPGDFLAGGLVYALTSPLRMVNITPGNLGVNEWAVALVGKLVAFDVTTGLIVAVVFRGIAVSAQGLGALLGLGWLALWSKP